MSTKCCHPGRGDEHQNDVGYKRVLWIALAINASMFPVEIGLGFAARSVALQADAVDSFGDAANYGISLSVVSLALHHREGAAVLKRVSMGLFGLWIVGSALWQFAHGTVPEASTMGLVGVAALLANGLTFVLLRAYRSGDSNMRSVWLCSRNDVIGNCAVLLAVLGGFGTWRGWPDVLVAAILGALAVQGSWTVMKTALLELAGAGA